MIHVCPGRAWYLHLAFTLQSFRFRQTCCFQTDGYFDVRNRKYQSSLWDFAELIRITIQVFNGSQGSYGGLVGSPGVVLTEFVGVAKKVWLAVADLHSKILDVPLFRSNFLHFDAVFGETWPKNTKYKVPFGKIMDHPMVSNLKDSSPCQS